MDEDGVARWKVPEWEQECQDVVDDGFHYLDLMPTRIPFLVTLK
jgi:hypothetical protein